MKQLFLATLLFGALAANAAVHQIAQLTPVDVGHVTRAGAYSVVVSPDGNTIVVGDESASVKANQQVGAVYVFVKPAGGWTNMSQTATLTASDGHYGTLLGCSVAIVGNTIVAGAKGLQAGEQGSAYVFLKPAAGWKDMTQTAELTPSDGVPHDYFGNIVSMSGNTIVASAPGVDNDQGAAYVFVKPQGGWVNMTETAKLVAADGQTGDYMQYAAIDGGLILTGAPHLYNTTPGAGYVFEGSGSTWSQVAELTATDLVDGENFGLGGGFSGNTAVLNAYKDQSPLVNSAYIFVKGQTGWSNMTETAEISIQPSGTGFAAGSISSNGSAILATAWDDNGGTAFVFLRPQSGWISTSTPSITFGAGDGFQNGMALGTPGIAALVVDQSALNAVLLFGQ